MFSGLKGYKQVLEKMAKVCNNDPRLLTDLVRQTLSYEVTFLFLRRFFTSC